MKLLTKIRRFPRALKVSHEARKLRDAEHIEWAAGLVTPKYKTVYMDNDTGEFYEMPCERKPSKWSFDPQDGFPYPPM